MISTTDIHWLAGLLEGEGCFGLSSGSIRISLHMTDKDVVDRVAKLFNTVVKKDKIYGNRKQAYRVEIFSHRAASWMMILYSLMGERRKERIKLSLEHWKNQRYKNPQGHGRRNPRCKSEEKQNETIINRY